MEKWTVKELIPHYSCGILPPRAVEIIDNDTLDDWLAWADRNPQRMRAVGRCYDPKDYDYHFFDVFQVHTNDDAPHESRTGFIAVPYLTYEQTAELSYWPRY